MTNRNVMTSFVMKKIYPLMIKAGLFILFILLPFIGIFLCGKPLAHYMEFPPLTRYVAHAAFSWPAFIMMTAFILIIVVPFILKAYSKPILKPIQKEAVEFALKKFHRLYKKSEIPNTKNLSKLILELGLSTKGKNKKTFLHILFYLAKLLLM